MSRVDIVKIKAANGVYHAVEEDQTRRVLFTSDTQKEAIDWARLKGHTIGIHRERNMHVADRHGQYRPQ